MPAVVKANSKICISKAIPSAGALPYLGTRLVDQPVPPPSWERAAGTACDDSRQMTAGGHRRPANYLERQRRPKCLVQELLRRPIHATAPVATPSHSLSTCFFSAASGAAASSAAVACAAASSAWTRATSATAAACSSSAGSRAAAASSAAVGPAAARNQRQPATRNQKGISKEADGAELQNSGRGIGVGQALANLPHSQPTLPGRLPTPSTLPTAPKCPAPSHLLKKHVPDALVKVVSDMVLNERREISGKLVQQLPLRAALQQRHGTSPCQPAPLKQRVLRRGEGARHEWMPHIAPGLVEGVVVRRLAAPLGEGDELERGAQRLLIQLDNGLCRPRGWDTVSGDGQLQTRACPHTGVTRPAALACPRANAAGCSVQV